MNVIIHLGQHKTGSKALQTALYANRSYLSQHGFTYPIDDSALPNPRPWEMNHHPLFFALRSAIDNDKSSSALRVLRDALEDLLALCQSQSQTMILSAEDLFDMHTAHETEFKADRIAAGANLLARELKNRDCDVKLICYVRRQDHLLAAHYAQLIKGTTSNYLSFDEFYQAFDKRLDTDSILRHWEAAFGTEVISMIPYERQSMQTGIVGSFFNVALGLVPPSVTVPYPDDLEALNITPSRDHIEYIRLLNRKQSRGKAVLAREQVLESAFRDQENPTLGIASWLSPIERIELLNRYADGNKKIASRYKVGSKLFQEPPPAHDSDWSAYQGLSLNRLLQLDTSARSITSTATFKEHRDDQLDKLMLAERTNQQPLVIWVLPKNLADELNALSPAFLNDIIGQPGFDAILVRHLDLKLLAQVRNLSRKLSLERSRDQSSNPSNKRSAMVVLFNSKQGSFTPTIFGWLLRILKIQCLTIQSDQAEEMQTLKLKSFITSRQHS